MLCLISVSFDEIVATQQYLLGCEMNGSFLVQERSWMEVMALLRVTSIINMRHVSLH